MDFPNVDYNVSSNSVVGAQQARFNALVARAGLFRYRPAGLRTEVDLTKLYIDWYRVSNPGFGRIKFSDYTFELNRWSEFFDVDTVDVPVTAIPFVKLMKQLREYAVDTRGFDAYIDSDHFRITGVIASPASKTPVRLTSNEGDVIPTPQSIPPLTVLKALTPSTTSVSTSSIVSNTVVKKKASSVQSFRDVSPGRSPSPAKRRISKPLGLDFQNVIASDSEDEGGDLADSLFQVTLTPIAGKTQQAAITSVPSLPSNAGVSQLPPSGMMLNPNPNSSAMFVPIPSIASSSPLSKKQYSQASKGRSSQVLDPVSLLGNSNVDPLAENASIATSGSQGSRRSERSKPFVNYSGQSREPSKKRRPSVYTNSSISQNTTLSSGKVLKKKPLVKSKPSQDLVKATNAPVVPSGIKFANDLGTDDPSDLFTQRMSISALVGFADLVPFFGGEPPLIVQFGSGFSSNTVQGEIPDTPLFFSAISAFDVDRLPFKPVLSPVNRNAGFAQNEYYMCPLGLFWVKNGQFICVPVKFRFASQELGKRFVLETLNPNEANSITRYARKVALIMYVISLTVALFGTGMAKVMVYTYTNELIRVVMSDQGDANSVAINYIYDFCMSWMADVLGNLDIEYTQSVKIACDFFCLTGFNLYNGAKDGVTLIEGCLKSKCLKCGKPVKDN